MEKKLILGAVLFIGIYLIMPKYEYIDDQTPDLLRFNKVTGNLEVCKNGEHWSKVVSKSIVKVERQTITYNEFMSGREQFQDFLRKAKDLNRK